MLVLLVLRRERSREVAVRNGATLVLTAGTLGVHVTRRISLVEVICLLEWPLGGTAGILNGSVREIRGDCLLRTYRCDVLCQSLSLRRAHS